MAGRVAGVPYMNTLTGREVNPLDVRIDDIDIRDIAHALACCNRFAGHLSSPVSVAQHSLYVSRIVRNMEGSPNLQLQGLLHDATEAYLGDVVKWLKESPAFIEYRRAELRLQHTIMEKFGCPPELDEMVVEADSMICDYEATQGSLNIGQRPTTTRECMLIGNWYFYDWRDAEAWFLRKYHDLTGRVRNHLSLV